MDPHILVKFVKQDGAPDQDEIASMIIFEWKDYDLIGVSVYTSGQRLGGRKNAECFHRMSFFAIRILSKLDIAMSIRQENSSLLQMQQSFPRTFSILRLVRKGSHTINILPWRNPEHTAPTAREAA